MFVNLRVVDGSFLSTLSLRRATQARTFALKTGNYFYPRSPCGERRDYTRKGIGRLDISIHALLAESDLYPMRAFEPIGISIHALLAESDHSDAFAAVSTLLISIHALLAESDIGRA